MNDYNKNEYDQFMEMAAQIDMIEQSVSGLDQYGEDTIDEDDYNDYVVKVSTLLTELSEIMRSKADDIWICCDMDG